MSTFTTMVSRIADDLNRSDINTQIKLAINRAIEFYAKSFNFYFNETSGTFNTTASQFIYTSSDSIPTDIAEIEYVKIALTSSNNIELRPRTYDFIQNINVGNTSNTGSPFYYAYYKQNFYIYPVPNGTYTITVSYRKRYSSLVNDADTNDFTTDAEDLIEARASWWIYNRILKDYDAAKEAKAEENEALLELQTATTRLNATGRLVPTTF